ncbi:type I restriction enzyme endonuclease domain-containing protein [Sporosarcina sp. 179-K 3D1 HS]|uniref:type I restriction enzyme endonuclease domain-containing protein n=1 Tax=Sporosarcina sp. 179-K 3D1 HS TaxID=3232169 RepID=UPI0039A130F0
MNSQWLWNQAPLLYKAGENVGMIQEEIALYDAQSSPDTAEQVLDGILIVIVHELTNVIKVNMNID